MNIGISKLNTKCLVFSSSVNFEDRNLFMISHYTSVRLADSQEFHILNPVDCSLPSKQEYWNGFPFPSPGDLPDLGVEPRSPALQ